MTEDNGQGPRRGVYILPNLLTTASLFTAFLGLLKAFEGDFEYAAICILVSCLFDGLDGKVARLTRTTSEFGVQLDSLADMVAFGMVPATVVYLWQLNQFGRLGLVTSFLMVACGALRLARFNVQTKTASKKYFTGLPIPAAACTLATLILFEPFLPASVAPKALAVFTCGLTFVLAFMMVSTFRFYSFKEYGWVKSHPFGSLVTVILLSLLVVTQPKVLGFVFFMGYLISGPILTLFVLSRRRARLLRDSDLS